MVEGVVELVKEYALTVAGGIAILFIGLAIGLLAKKLLTKLFKEIGLNKIMNRVGITNNLEKIVGSIISYVIYLVFIVIFLNHLGITSIVLYIIVGAILMLLILTFLVGLKDVIPNFVAWLAIQRKGSIKVGRRIDVREISGRVEKTGFLETEIKTDNGDILYVPNSLFLKSKFKLNKD